MEKRIQYDSLRDILRYRALDRAIFLVSLFYISDEMFDAVLRRVFGMVGVRGMVVITENTVLILLLLYIYCTFFLNRRQGFRKLRVWPVYLFAIASILLSLWLHPEYSDWFHHREYGLNIWFLQLRRGFFGLLIVGLFSDKRKLLTSVVWTSRFNLVYYLVRFFNYLQRGYWYAYSGSGELLKLDYNLTLGYLIAFVCVLFLGLYLFNRKLPDLICSLTAFVIILLAGSRGPMICLGAAFLLFEIYRFTRIRTPSGKLLALFAVGMVVLIVVIIGLPVISMGFIRLLSSLNIDSRTVEKLLAGEIMNDSGRSNIYEISRNMIRNGGPFGYGFYGDRYVIGRTWHYGYPHSIFYEILIEYGVLLGGVLIAIFAFLFLRMLFRCRDDSWMLLLIVFFCSSIKLMLSDSFWYYWPFWGLLGVLGLWSKEYRRTVAEKRRRVSIGIRREIRPLLSESSNEQI